MTMFLQTMYTMAEIVVLWAVYADGGGMLYYIYIHTYVWYPLSKLLPNSNNVNQSQTQVNTNENQ